MSELILAVDDNERILGVLKVILDREGFLVITAGNGHEALAKIKSEAPSLVLLDISLPDISGVKLLEDIRRISAVPVILLSGLTEVGRSIERHASVRFVAKPFHPADLVEEVRLALQK